jgi:hypothetical protein
MKPDQQTENNGQKFEPDIFEKFDHQSLQVIAVGFLVSRR